MSAGTSNGNPDISIAVANTSPIKACDTSLSLAVVGLGYWGPNLVRNLHEIPAAAHHRLRPYRRRAKAICRRFPSVDATTEYREVLADAGVDAVIVATPICTHHSLAAPAASRAGKHVMVEKPLAASSTRPAGHDPRQPGGPCPDARPHVLYSPPVIMIRSLIESGELGMSTSFPRAASTLGCTSPM